MTLTDYNNANPVKEIKTVTLGNDVYTLEIRNNYHVLINGIFNKSYQRLSSDLKQFFNI